MNKKKWWIHLCKLLNLNERAEYRSMDAWSIESAWKKKQSKMEKNRKSNQFHWILHIIWVTGLIVFTFVNFKRKSGQPNVPNLCCARSFIVIILEKWSISHTIVYLWFFNGWIVHRLPPHHAAHEHRATTYRLLFFFLQKSFWMLLIAWFPRFPLKSNHFNRIDQ